MVIFGPPGGGSCLFQACVRLVICSLIDEVSYSKKLGACDKLRVGLKGLTREAGTHNLREGS